MNIKLCQNIVLCNTFSTVPNFLKSVHWLNNDSFSKSYELFFSLKFKGIVKSLQFVLLENRKFPCELAAALLLSIILEISCIASI